ncbi:hypothetical protein [Sphingomonas mesophila]|uniref:hypothetical protein n=1 Tax=Sphingomonas mesophila TaxID=2303576 RepID=UPI000E590530|nr:hypothetical protein [Sphingomonas mesophila]
MRALLIAVALATSPAAARPLTASEQVQLDANLARGDQLYAYDQAAWHITDAALKVFPKDAASFVRGYVVTPDTGGLRTTFYGGESGRYFRVYSAIWTGRRVASPQSFERAARVPVTAEEARLIEAKRIALGSGADEVFLCSKSAPNSAVIPGRTSADPISVYVLTSTTAAGVVHLGGHARIDVKDGKVVGRRNFTRGCISYDAKSARVPAGAKPEMFVLTHSLDPVPTEIHAFSLHYLPVSLGVATTSTGLLFMMSLDKGRSIARATAADPPNS